MNVKESKPDGFHSIRIIDYLSPGDYEEINELEKLCCRQDGINLKLELESKLHLSGLAAEKKIDKPSRMNDFLYYIGDQLVSYLGISCFDGTTGELCGMTHPDYRERGIFHRLLALALCECRHGRYKMLLLLADGTSTSGMSFLNTAGSGYEHSEYRMKRSSVFPSETNTSHPISELTDYDTSIRSKSTAVTLRQACKEDELEIAKQNAIFFGASELDTATVEPVPTPLEEDPENCKTYMIMLQDAVIGKIKVEYGENSAFICGFGIRPEYRGKGYGRVALSEALHMIESKHIELTELDVVCTNSNALGLYKSCGFTEVSVMNYYTLA